MVSSDKELEVQLVDAGKKLLRPPPSIDDLLPLLDHVENCLSKVEQSPRKSMQDALSTLQKALVANELVKHSEVDVKVAVASCISEITRISAPEAPYVDDVMKEVFQLIVSSFDNISNKSSRSFVKRVSILETVSKVRSCVVMLDLECDSLIVEMFRHFFREIRDYHDENVFSSMETIMTLVIDESEDISADLLCLVLDSVKKDEKASPMSKKLGEKVLENCAKKLKPFLGPSLKSLGVNSDDYCVIVASICDRTNGVFEQSIVQAVSDERAVSPEDGPASVVSPNTIGSNGLTSRDKSPTVSNSLKKEEDGHENLTPKESVDVNEGKQGNNDITSEVELRPEQDSIKTENEPSSSAEASNLATDTVITEDSPQKKEDQPLECSPEQPASLLQKDTHEPGLPAESRVKTSVELHSSKTPQNESADTALLNQNDDVPNESKACEEGSSKQEAELEGAEVPSNDLAENKNEEKEDLAGEINASMGGGVTSCSSSEEKTLTVEDSVKDTEAASDSAATKSNKSKTKVNVKPEKKKIMSGRMQEEREIFKPPNKGNDALKSSKHSDKKEMSHPLKSSGKERQLSVETPKGSLKRNDTPSKEEGSGGKKDGAVLVGSKIKVWWPMDKAFYKGRVVDFDAVTKKHRILYLDGDVEVLFLRKERWEIVKDDSGDEDEAVEGDSLDASLETPPKKAKLMKPTHSATKQGKMVSINKQGGGSSSSKSKVDATTLTACPKSKDRREDDAGGESSSRTPKSGHKSVNSSSDKVGKSKDNDASTSSKVTNSKGNVSGPKNPPIQSKHGTPKSSSKSKSKQESNSKPMGKGPKIIGKSRNKDDSGKAIPIPSKSKDSEATDEEEEEEDFPGSPTAVASKKKRKMSGSSSSKGNAGTSGGGKKRRRGA